MENSLCYREPCSEVEQLIEVVRYSHEQKADWDDFVHSAKNAVFHFYRDYMDYHSDRFIDFSIIIKKHGKIVALFPANFDVDNRKIISHAGLTFGGFITRPDLRTSDFIEVFDTALSFYRNKGVSRIIIKCLPQPFTRNFSQEQEYILSHRGGELIKRELSTIIDLSARGKVSQSRKRNINKARKQNVTVNRSYDFTTFIELQNKALEKHNTKAVHTAEELELLSSRFPKQIQLYFAEHNSVILAACIIFNFEHVVHTQYLATSKAGKDIKALDFLIEELIGKANEEQRRFFSLGISTTDSGRELNYGLCQQKERFGGHAVVLDTYEVRT